MTHTPPLSHLSHQADSGDCYDAKSSGAQKACNDDCFGTGTCYYEYEGGGKYQWCCPADSAASETTNLRGSATAAASAAAAAAPTAQEAEGLLPVGAPRVGDSGDCYDAKNSGAQKACNDDCFGTGTCYYEYEGGGRYNWCCPAEAEATLLVEKKDAVTASIPAFIPADCFSADMQSYCVSQCKSKGYGCVKENGYWCCDNM